MITEPKVMQKGWSGAASSIDFYIQYEMMESPMRMVAYDKNQNYIVFPSTIKPREVDALKGFWSDYDALLLKWRERK